MHSKHITTTSLIHSDSNYFVIIKNNILCPVSPYVDPEEFNVALKERKILVVSSSQFEYCKKVRNGAREKENYQDYLEILRQHCEYAHNIEEKRRPQVIENTNILIGNLSSTKEEIWLNQYRKLIQVDKKRIEGLVDTDLYVAQREKKRKKEKKYFAITQEIPENTSQSRLRQMHYIMSQQTQRQPQKQLQKQQQAQTKLPARREQPQLQPQIQKQLQPPVYQESAQVQLNISMHAQSMQPLQPNVQMEQHLFSPNAMQWQQTQGQHVQFHSQYVPPLQNNQQLNQQIHLSYSMQQLQTQPQPFSPHMSPQSSMQMQPQFQQQHVYQQPAQFQSNLQTQPQPQQNFSPPPLQNNQLQPLQPYTNASHATLWKQPRQMQSQQHTQYTQPQQFYAQPLQNQQTQHSHRDNSHHPQQNIQTHSLKRPGVFAYSGNTNAVEPVYKKAKLN